MMLNEGIELAHLERTTVAAKAKPRKKTPPVRSYAPPVERRLLIYLLLDCSAAMAGEPLEAIRQGLRALLSDLKGDPHWLEMAYLSVITFGNAVRQRGPLTELSEFHEPALQASGARVLGAALELLEQRLDQEVRKSTPEAKGDWQPLVVLMSNGSPTDRWEPVVERIKQKGSASFIACAAGPGADLPMLKRIADDVVEIDKLQPDTFKSLFKLASQKIAQTVRKASVPLPAPPRQIVTVP